MQEKISGIQEMGSAASATPAQQMRAMFQEAVREHSDMKQSAVFEMIGRRIGLPAGRVKAIFYGEIQRVWADEIDAARVWYAAELERYAARSAHNTEMFRIRATALRERLCSNLP